MIVIISPPYSNKNKMIYKIKKKLVGFQDLKLLEIVTSFPKEEIVLNLIELRDILRKGVIVYSPLSYLKLYKIRERINNYIECNFQSYLKWKIKINSIQKNIEDPHLHLLMWHQKVHILVYIFSLKFVVLTTIWCSRINSLNVNIIDKIRKTL